MPNVSPPCGICAHIEGITNPKVKEQIVGILNDSAISAAKAREALSKFGLNRSDKSIRTHRKESQPNVKMVENVAAPNPVDVPTKPPAGWEPYIEYTEAIGSAIVRLPLPGATHRTLLIESGFDPDEWQISGPVQTRKWMRYDQQWLYYYKFDVVAGESPEAVEEHIDELVAFIRERPQISYDVPEGNDDDAFVFAISDWQIGKKEGQDGTTQTIARVIKSVDLAIKRIEELRASGRQMPTLLIASTGDIGENTCGFYPGQQFLIDRNRREQNRISRELITMVIDRLGPYFNKIIVAAVGGNHGENRNLDTKRITDDGDNDDCAQYEAVKEAFDRAGETGIEWHIMDDELSMALHVGGVDIGLTHGHLFQRGATPQQKAYEWWKSQDFNFQAVRGTKILLTSHFHHFSAIVHGSRTHLQTPAMDPGSKWYRDTSGEDSPPGTLTFRLSGKSILGWEDLAILDPR